MNKRKSKKIFLGLSILSFLVSGITATSIFWSFNKNFSDYEKIYTELKKARDLVNSPNYKKSADDILKNPNYKTFSRENVADINEVLSKIIVQIDKEIKVYISKINSASKKVKLNTDLLNSQNSIDAKRKIKDNALKLIDIELVKDINLEKIEAKKLIENIKNSTKKAEFEKKLPFIKSINDIELLISDVEKELKKQSINDYISAKKKALIAKTNASTLNKEEKKKLLELFKDLKTTSTLFDNEIIINYEILKDALKKQAANRIELLENDNFKKIIKNSFGKAKTIKDYYDILIRINEYEFGRINNTKIDPKDKTDLLNKIGQIKTIITPSDNVLANDSGIKMIINETILDLKNSLDYLEKNEVQNKKSELNELIKKLTELKKEIDDLKNTDVLEYSKTRKELAKKLAKSKDDQSIEDTKLYIKKAKLKKKASELPYPNGVDSVAIYEINSRIDSTKKDNLKSIEDLISKLPKKINEAKELIAQISKSGKDINGQRTKDLNDQLSRSVDDKDFDKLKENIQRTKIKILIISLPYPNPNSTDAQNSKSILNNKVNNAKTKQELDNLNSQINALNVKMNQFINLLSRIPYDDDKPKTAIETIKKVLDKTTTVQDVENILPDNWGQRISEYKTIINDSYLDQAPINNLLTRLNQTVPSTLRDNKPFPIGDYKENQLINEILYEFKQESISTINQLSNLKTRQKAQFDNITKRVNDINPKNYQWNSIESAIILIKQQTNDAIKLNYDLFIDNNLAYPSKSNLSSLVSETKKRIKMHLTSGVTRKTKADVEKKLNELKTKIDMVKTKISKVKNIVQTSNKMDEFEHELAQTDDQNIDNLIVKIDKYNHAITLLEQIKNDTDKINLKGNLSSASTLDQINDVIRDINVKISEINNAKLRAQNAINSIPDKYNTHKHSKNLKQEYTKQLMNKDNLSLDVLNKLIADAELEKYRFETQDWIDAKLDKYNNKGLNLYNKLNHNDQTPTRDSVDQIRKEVEAELEHIKKDITDRVRTELFDNATALYRRIDRNDKRHVYAEQSYYEWFKEEIKKQPSEMKVNELEYKFITERYAESVRIRAFLVSFQYNIEHSNEFNANQELRSNILNEIKKYATEYQTNDSRDDKFDGFTIYDFWRTFNLYLRNLEINHKLSTNIKTVIRKLFSLSGQVEAPDANITTTQNEISNKVDKSIISKVLQKIKGNSIQNSQYTASDAYKIINMLFVKTISDNTGNTYDKILNLKSDNVFANIISGNGSKGLIQGAELWNSNLQKENS